MSISKFRTILLDIEGTTTSISFVHDILFPYAATHLETFLRQNSNQFDVKECILLIKQQADIDLASSVDTFGAVPVPEGDERDIIAATVENVRQAMERDRKLTGLKQLQGLIWKDGYESKQVTSQVYPDVLNAFKRWKASEPPYDICIYSSGSISAQQLLFQYTGAGDLRQYLSGYYDTTSGSKVESSSYVKIARDRGQVPHEILFLTDNIKEARAALEGGMGCLLVDRPGNAPLSEQDRKIAPIITSFDQMDSYLHSKRL